MKKNILICTFASLGLFAKAQDTTLLQIDTLSYAETRLTAISTNLLHLLEKQYTNKPRYKLFPTTNMWTFLKLDTQKGHITHVQFGLDDGDDFEYSLGSPYSTYSTTYDELIENGRFTLYSTQNSYNFILLDQISGQTWQVQWNHKQNKRLVIPIN